jgi:hypothetical protein
VVLYFSLHGAARRRIRRQHERERVYMRRFFPVRLRQPLSGF